MEVGKYVRTAIILNLKRARNEKRNENCTRDLELLVSSGKFLCCENVLRLFRNYFSNGS